MAQEKTKPRVPISWDECFMQMAHTIAMRSRDPNTQNGAVVVNQQKVVVGMGYNGFPRGVDDSQLPWEREGKLCDTKYAYVVHAEENAIYNSNANTSGCKLYCTLFPCNECAKTIIQSGIVEVIYESDKYHDNEVWVASRKLLDLAGVTYRQFQPVVSESQKTELTLKIKKLSADAITPSYAYQHDAGMDLYSIEDVEIPPGSRAKVGTGLAIEVPQGYASLIWDKSGVSVNKGLKTLGGVIDSGYRGEYFVGFVNVSRESVNICKGEKIAQLIIQKVEHPSVELTDDLSKSQRGENGFGSSDFKKVDPVDDLGLEFLPDEAMDEEDEYEELIEASGDQAESDLEVPTEVVGEGGQNGKSRW